MPDGQLYTDLPCGLLIDAENCPCYERTGHHGQYEVRKFFFLIPFAKSVATAARTLNECQIKTPIIMLEMSVIYPT